MRYSDTYKKMIRGDDCCGFWRSAHDGSCAGWPGDTQPDCPANEDGTGCPLFPRVAGKGIIERNLYI